MSANDGYSKLTLRLAWQLSAPHTWAASIFPVLAALCFAIARGFTISISIALSLLAISVLLQSAVNTINDYFDYVKGTDSEDDNVEVDDAVLVYSGINPKSARNLAVGFIVCAFALGIYCIWYAGWMPLVIALIGVVVIFLYSGGKTPISYLPIGEAVSGLVMGMLITFASYAVITRTVEWLVLVWSIPLVIAIALIMMTNNTCDIEKDIAASRKTLPVLLGQKRAVVVYHALVYIWYISIVIIVGIWFTPGLLIAPFMILATYPMAKALMANPLLSKSRIQAMSQICGLNIALGTFYCLSILAVSIKIIY